MYHHACIMGIAFAQQGTPCLKNSPVIGRHEIIIQLCGDIVYDVPVKGLRIACEF
jgi:hypothetical protein